MSVQGRLVLSIFFALLGCEISLQGMFPSQTQNDPLPLFSSVFPNDFLATRQKANLMRFDYTYAPARFRVSVSGYRQYANRAKSQERETIYLGDLKGRWNMLALFYDPKMSAVLQAALGLDYDKTTCEKKFIEDPKFSDPRQEFGFFSIPLLYRKYGVRFESELLLIDRCFYAVGIMAQWGLNDIRQTVLNFNDMTCQALGEACPTSSIPRGVTDPGTCPEPTPQAPPGVAPPFIDPTQAPPCPIDDQGTCVVPLQTFQPLCDQTLNFGFPAECKRFVIENIMSQRDKIADLLGLDICNYHKVGMDDLRLSMYWRHLFVINEDNEQYPRLIFMPFAQVGVGIPMMKEIKNNIVFALPNGNNRHTFVGGRAGFTLDFLDTIDIYAAGGFSYFFEREYCNFYMPTNPKESGIFPYSADVTIRPGPTWTFNVGMNAYRFLDNLSVWAEYAIVSHTPDKIKVCRSFIPDGSIYFESGFDVERAECFSKWEVHVVNVGFNYDLFDCLSLGILWQAPAKQRNAYRSGMVMGTLTFVF
jgi:hypothetical protein